MWEGGGRQCRGGAPGCSQGRGRGHTGHTPALWSLLTWPPSSRQALGEGLKEEGARSPQMQALGAGAGFAGEPWAGCPPPAAWREREGDYKSLGGHFPCQTPAEASLRQPLL